MRITPQTRLDQLVNEGGVIHLCDQGHLELTLAGALWLARPRRLRWCAIFPEHQGHIHELRYDTTELENDSRDVVFRRSGAMVATVVPYAEAGLDIQEVQDALSEWHYLLGRYTNAENFVEFLREA